MESKNYLRAARLLATCPQKRLKEVVRLLRESGIEIDDDFLREEEYDKESLKMSRRMNRRKGEYENTFWESDDDFMVALLNAYKRGIGITKLSRATGVSRTTIYRYLHRESYPSESDKKCILSGIEELIGGGVN